MSDALDEATRLYKESLDALSDQRKQIAEDIRFSDPADPDQWEADIKHQREHDPGGKRPCLVLDQTGQYVAQVTGQIEKQPPSLHAIPVGDGAEKKAAEQIDGRFRHIESASRAQQHYARAMTLAARVGVGYLIVRPEYVDKKLNWQEPRISSVGDSLKVIFDPWSDETDGSDADFGFLLSEISEREFKRRWPKAEIKDFGDADSKRVDGKSIVVGEQWLKVYGDDGAMTVQWRRMNGVEMLEETTYPADHIGIVPIYGYTHTKGGRLSYCGIPRRARAAQQAYNYHLSELMTPRSTILIPARGLASESIKANWDRIQVERRGYQAYIDMDADGPVQPPHVANLDTVNHELGMQRALADIQASIGMYQANLGAPSNETSGVAIESRKEQGESSTAHFPSHMAASLGQLGRIVMQMDARLLDERRSVPIMGIDGSAGRITVNPEQQEAFTRLPNGGGVSINPNVGSYGVRVVVGASYSTQRTQTNAAFAEIMRGNPELAPTVAPFWAQTLDFPGSEKFAQALASMAPPAVKAILQPEGGGQEQDPAMLAQKVGELTQAVREAIQHAQEAQQEADQAAAECQSLKQDKEVAQAEVQIKAQAVAVDRFEAETKRMEVQAKAQDAGAKRQMDALTLMHAQEPVAPEAQEPAEPEQSPPELAEIVAGQAAVVQQLAQLARVVSAPRVLQRDAQGNAVASVAAPTIQ